MTAKLCMQSLPQLMPARSAGDGAEAVADSATEISRGIAEKFALTSTSGVIVTVQEPVPLHAPPQPANVEPAAGAAVSVIDVPCATVWVQSVPQLIPAARDGARRRCRARVTVSVLSVRPKVAVTLRAAVMSTTQAPVPVQAPLQPVNTLSTPGAALSWTSVPCANDALQVAPQLMPAGVLVTVPVPPPVAVAPPSAAAASARSSP